MPPDDPGTEQRGWRASVLDAVAPGWSWWRGQPMGRRVAAAALLVCGTAFPIGVGLYALLSGRNWVALSLDAGFLLWLAVALAVAVAIRVAWSAPRLWSQRNRGGDLAVGLAVLLVVAVPLSVGAVGAVRARESIAPVFTETADGAPLFDVDETTPVDDEPDASPVTATSAPVTDSVDRVGEASLDAGGARTTTTTTDPPPLPEQPLSGVDPEVVADVHNILILGGDAGPDRGGLRTDTMMLLSVDTGSGRAGLVSLPRDMKGLLFPVGTPLEARYPYGFTNLANAVYPIVSSDRTLREAYTAADIRPGVYATAQAIGYSLDVTIHDYVLIDMQGFVDLIDAVGGVTVNVSKELPMPGNIPGGDAVYPDTIGPGVVDMNGTIALGYVRSRYADSDFQRTARQRKLVAALASQVSFTDVLARFGEVTSAIGGTLRTSLTPDELAEILALIGGETAIVESVGLVPPLVDITSPDFQRMAEVVGAVRVAVATGEPSGY